MAKCKHKEHTFDCTVSSWSVRCRIWDSNLPAASSAASLIAIFSASISATSEASCFDECTTLHAKKKKKNSRLKNGFEKFLASPWKKLRPINFARLDRAGSTFFSRFKMNWSFHSNNFTVQYALTLGIPLSVLRSCYDVVHISSARRPAFCGARRHLKAVGEHRTDPCHLFPLHSRPEKTGSEKFNASRSPEETTRISVAFHFCWQQNIWQKFRTKRTFFFLCSFNFFARFEPVLFSFLWKPEKKRAKLLSPFVISFTEDYPVDVWN